MVVAPELLSGLNAKQLRELARDLIAQIANRDQAISARELRISERELQISERDQQIASLGQTHHQQGSRDRVSPGQDRPAHT